MKSVLDSQSTIGSRIVSITHWFEDCTYLYVQLVRNPPGIGFPDKETPDTMNSFKQSSIQVGRLNQIIAKYPQDNLWRSWQLFSDESCLHSVSFVPLLIDIDNGNRNLEGAYSLTRVCLDLIEKFDRYISKESLRVIFSGMKGFHIEAIPSEPTDNQTFRDTLLEALEQFGLQNTGCKNCFEDGTIDRGNSFVRLTGSINSWREGGNIRKRKVIQFTPDLFRESQLVDIVAESETAH